MNDKSNKMIVYIPQDMDVNNHHLQNLVNAYEHNNCEVVLGTDSLLFGNVCPDILHIHMPEALLRRSNYNTERILERIRKYKSQGVRVLYTAHNLLPHNTSSGFDYKKFYNDLFEHVDLFVHHGKRSIVILKESFINLNDKKHIVCHHGDYCSNLKMYTESRAEARKILRLPQDKKIIMILGRLEDKNTNFAMQVLKDVQKEDRDIVACFAGFKPISRYKKINQKYCALYSKFISPFQKRIMQRLKFLSDHELYLYLSAADVVFLPHENGLTSGIIPLSASASIPIVYPNIGCFANQAEYTVSSHYKANDRSDAKSALLKTLKCGESFDNTQWLKFNSWDIHVKKILANI